MLARSLLAGQFRPAGFLDDAYPQPSGFDDVSVLGRIEDMARHAFAARWAVVAIGDNDVRRRGVAALRALGIRLATIVHPQAVVSPSDEIGEGVTIMAGAIIGTESRIVCGVIVNCGAVVDHHCLVAEIAHIGIGCLDRGWNENRRIGVAECGLFDGLSRQRTR